ncbi:ankyrin repeat domain-containing protein 13C-like isoform X2 [Physella acuta]|uniref:ankyrin repeat domain-containing protein 13C-like isoform X2 n=1 Tax=Physella acuta TaxID=109671 RepID=UPI0027DD4372|nr:ankyrin repeat domain-containing protein 13C-like isoform X2 [Physella acuta]
MASHEYQLHQSVFNGDVKLVSKLIRTCDVSQKDIHGNTPLHLAIMLGHKECIHLLLAHGAPVKFKNALGWTPLAEAISYGERQIILSVLRKLKQQSREALEERRPLLVQALKDIRDFDLELKWDFQSWVPLVSRILPSDICRIRKKGSRIRLDTTLVDFTEMKWERGDITFLFNGEAKPRHSLSVLDNKAEVFQRVRYEDSDLELEEEVDILMSSDIVAAQMSTKRITFSRAQTGWLFREDKSEMVGDYRSDFFSVNNLVLESKKRREHLSTEDIQKNKAIMENFSKGSWDNAEASNGLERRRSLQAPEKTSVSWDDYISAPTGRPPCLGRTLISKESSKAFKATVGMSDEFPMTVEVLLDVLEVVAPFKQFQKLRDFMTSKLPPGFPVRIEIPVFPTITAKVTFTTFEWKDDLDKSLFSIPSHYKEDPGRFPDL